MNAQAVQAELAAIKQRSIADRLTLLRAALSARTGSHPKKVDGSFPPLPTLSR